MDLSFHTAPDLSDRTSQVVQVQCCFTSTDTIGPETVRDEEPQDGHLDFHTAPEFCLQCCSLTTRETIRTSTSTQLLSSAFSAALLRPERP